MSNILVAYFSAGGITEKAARQLAEVLNADLMEIKPSEHYTAEDLDWTDKKSRSSVEMNDPDARPEIADKPENIDKYDKVFIGFPIWWYVAPRIIETFMDSYDFSGKSVIPFATSGGSGIEKAEKALKESYPGNIKWLKGRLLNGVSRKEIEEWISSL